jgi:hypothetical protein
MAMGLVYGPKPKKKVQWINYNAQNCLALHSSFSLFSGCLVYSSFLKMEGVRSSETSLNSNRTVLSHILEYSILQVYCNLI